MTDVDFTRMHCDLKWFNKEQTEDNKPCKNRQKTTLELKFQSITFTSFHLFSSISYLIPTINSGKLTCRHLTVNYCIRHILDRNLVIA